MLEPDSWTQLADRRDSVHAELEGTELLEHLKAAIDSRLTSHQRRVFVALAVNEVPIDVLSERSARGAGSPVQDSSTTLAGSSARSWRTGSWSRTATRTRGRSR